LDTQIRLIAQCEQNFIVAPQTHNSFLPVGIFVSLFWLDFKGWFFVPKEDCGAFIYQNFCTKLTTCFTIQAHLIS
jgi:hypothetical protein